MRKFTLLIASLFITIGAMAQVLTDGVYTIQADENGKRGYLAVAEGLERPVLTEISWASYAQNSYADILENGKYWYVKTIEGLSFLYNVANGCFIVDDGTENIFVKSDVASVLNIKNHNAYIHVGSGTGKRYLSMGCGTTAPNQVKWETGNENDGGCLLTFTAVENGTTTFATQIAAAAPIIDAAIEEYLNNWKQTVKNHVGYVGGYSYEQEAIIDAISTVAEKNEFENTAERLAISTSAYYRLVCVAPKTGNGGDVTYNTLTFNGESNLVTAPRDNSNENQIFTFEDAGDGKYYLKNKIADGYLNKITQGDGYRSAIVAKEDACKLQLLAYNELQWELNNSEGADKHSLFAENHPSETVPYACSGWDDGANSASAWHIILAGDITSNEVAKAVLGETINTAMAYYEVLTIGEAVGEYTTSIEGFYEEMGQISVYYGNITESTPIEEIEAKTARVNEIIASFTPNMPVDGKAYTFKNVQKNGSVCWFKYDTENDEIGLTGTEEEATKFACTKLENGKYTFTFDNGKYLIWRGSSNGNNDKKGYMDEYDETWAQLTIEKMTTGGQISGDLTATRYVTINGRRHNNTADANSFNYIVIKTGPVFDQANLPFYNDTFSSAFIMDEVELVPTAIENVEVENAEQVIYDLTGRRVETITEPGIYIVGGKKVLVK